TKTLAKLANHLAKSLPRLQGVCDLSGLNHAGLLRAIRHVPVGDVWGVGRRLAPSLEASGIRTAADLARADRHELRRRYSIVLAKTARELCGEPAIGWEDAPSPKQQIMSTRSFGRPVRDLTELEQAVTCSPAAPPRNCDSSIPTRLSCRSTSGPAASGPAPGTPTTPSCRWTGPRTIPPCC